MARERSKALFMPKLACLKTTIKTYQILIIKSKIKVHFTITRFVFEALTENYFDY